MDIRDFISIGRAFDRLTDKVTPESSASKLWKEMKRRFGIDLQSRTEKLVEEAKELSHEADMLTVLAPVLNQKKQCVDHAEKLLWETADVVALTIQIVHELAEASGCTTKEMFELLIGMSIYKYNTRDRNPDFLHDCDEE